MHDSVHPLANQTVKIRFMAPHSQFPGLEHEFTVEDWWDHMTGGSWMFADGNPACLIFAMRMGFGGILKTDDEVIYGKINGFGVLIHTDELVLETAEQLAAAGVEDTSGGNPNER